MTDSILDTTKKVLQIDPTYTVFDIDIIMHINSVFFTLSQIGVGPATGFSITDKEANWVDFLGEATNLEAVKSYMYLKVCLLFDPPATSFAIASMEKMIEEYEWRLNIKAEGSVTV